MNSQSNKVVRILGASFAPSAPHHNIKAFMSLGLIPVECDARFFLRVVPEKARRVRESAEFEPAGEIFPPDAHGLFRMQTGIAINDQILNDFSAPDWPGCSCVVQAKLEIQQVNDRFER
jgi:hypothetical protein